MITWDEVVKADPRIGQLADAAVEAVRYGDPHDDFPDGVYTDVKRYLDVLIAAGRGRAVRLHPAGRNRPYEHRFAAVVAAPAPVTAATDEKLLASFHTHRFVCTHIFDRLCEVYDRRMGSAA